MSENVLIPKQRRGLTTMLTCLTIMAAAGKAGMSEKTIYRWLAHLTFAAELKAAQVGENDYFIHIVRDDGSKPPLLQADNRQEATSTLKITP